MNTPRQLTYKAAGVDIDQGDEFIRRIRPAASATKTPFSMDAIGSFAGLIDLTHGSWKDPILVTCTDGVGTKLKVAFEMKKHRTIGIDLVAMSINDLLVTGAEPVAFLDYLATSRLDLDVHTQVVEGIAEGCIISSCALVGGETAELPGFYAEDEYDLAGFAVGIVDRSMMLLPERVKPGDVLIGLPSSGIHSNGYSLVRKVFEDRTKFPLDKPIFGSPLPLGDQLLIPTRIYSREFSVFKACSGIKAAAHITGGGIPGNLPRALPEALGIKIFTNSWPVPSIFQQMKTIGNISDTEMYRTFNMGLGMIVIVDPDYAEGIQSSLNSQGLDSYRIGVVTHAPGFHWTDHRKTLRVKDPIKQKSSAGAKTRTRIAILGSGGGSNMEAVCRAIDREDLSAEIVCVISNNSGAYILERARRRKIPAYHVSSKTQSETESEVIMKLLSDHRVDVLVLAGYMKKISPSLLNRYKGSIFNIHPALLPAFGGKGMFGRRVHEAVIRSGAKFSGVTVHRVENDYDSGHILAQRIVPVLASDTAESLSERVLTEEHDLYWRVLRQYISIRDE